MSFIQSLQNLTSSARVSRSGQVQQELNQNIAVKQIDQTATGDFFDARTRLQNLYRGLLQLAELANVKTRFKLDLPDAQSANALGLDLTQTAASLVSSEEINASPMSFSPFGPDWNDGSDALITIGGEYDGADLSGAVSFEVRRDGTHGVDDLRIRIDYPQGNPRNINIRAIDPEDRQYSLQNGLYFTLGPGSLIDRDTTTIQVFDNQGAAVNPNNPLGGIRNNNPNLQFGTPAIVDGSFLLNGENISVATTDSLSDIVNRINLSTAGVSAIFNAGTERIEFLQDTPGSIPGIDLQSDTSNFLQATKLNGAVVSPGIDAESDQSFEDVAVFSSIQTGDIRINDQLITIDTSVDSLSTVIGKINASSAGVVASFDTNTQRVLIEAGDAESVLDLDSNGTGFFAALSMPEGRVDPEAVSRGISRRRSYDIADATAEVFREINDLFRDTSFVGGGKYAGQFREPLEEAIRALYGDSLSGNMFGLLFDGSSDARQRGGFAEIDRRALTRNLQLRGDAVQGVLGGGGDDAGLIQGLLNGTRQALANVNQTLGLTGSFIDTFV